MDATEAYERREDVTFVDVREDYEWEAGTVADAVHIPIGTLARRVGDVPADKDVVVICQIGQRSALAADFLNRNGYKAYNLEGGVEAWLAKGYPLVSGKGDAGRVVDGWAQTPELP